MGINKVQYGNTTLIDLTSDTVTADKLLQGYTAHDRTGTIITGTASGGGDTPVWQGSDYYVYLSDTAQAPVEIYVDDDGYVVLDIQPPALNLQTKTATYTPTESQQSATITADIGYDGLEEVDITVNAISDSYVGSGIARRSSSDLTASGATVTVPSGYYSAQASKAVASGTDGTPTATKGAVSNHSISVTPSVTNTAGYISGGTKTGTAVSVSASELVSGTKSITANGTGIDVTEFASVDVSVSGGGGVTVTDEANSTGITCVITSGSSPTPPSPDIPLNTQLIDYTAVTNDYALNVSGGLDPAQWYAVSDYTEISSTMTFAYTGIYWGYLGFYDSSKNPISTIYMVNDATQRQDDSNFGDGTLTTAKIPLNAGYVRITTQANPDSTKLSLIRTS